MNWALSEKLAAARAKGPGYFARRLRKADRLERLAYNSAVIERRVMERKCFFRVTPGGRFMVQIHARPYGLDQAYVEFEFDVTDQVAQQQAQPAEEPPKDDLPGDS